MRSDNQSTGKSRFLLIVGIILIAWTCLVFTGVVLWLARPVSTADINSSPSPTLGEILHPNPSLPTVDTPTITSTSPPPLDISLLGKIVFTCYIGGFDEICIMRADGNGQTRLTDDPATDFYASLSPDGQTIVFSSRRDGRFEIYSMSVNGSHQQRLTRDIGAAFAPAVSPDGMTILFANDIGPNQTLWLMDIDGRNPRQLTDSPYDDIDPTWSPDGDMIAFASSRSGERQLFVMNADGSGIRQVTDLPDMGGRHTWSADARQLAFYAGPRGDHDIHTINLDGTGLRQLTAGGDNLAPSFSPNGEWITFTSYRHDNNEIYIMRPDGSQVTLLTDNTRPDWQPRWGP